MGINVNFWIIFLLIEKYVVIYLVLMNKILWIDSIIKVMKNGVYIGILVIFDNN